QLVRLLRWAGERTVRERLLLILHVGYAFLPLGFLLNAAAAFDFVPASAGIHAWMAGGAGIMTLGVVRAGAPGPPGPMRTGARDPWPHRPDAHGLASHPGDLCRHHRRGCFAHLRGARPRAERGFIVYCRLRLGSRVLRLCACVRTALARELPPRGHARGAGAR